MSRLSRIFTILVVLSMFMSMTAPGSVVNAAQPRNVENEQDPPSSKSFVIPPGKAQKLAHEGAILEAPVGSVSMNTVVTITPLVNGDLPSLDQGMNNVTRGPRSGYRMLPHNLRFNKKVVIKLPYDPALIPPGLSEQDLKTFFFNDQTGAWQELERVRVDTQQKLVISLSNHFTDFINATLTVPDHPETLALNPNSIKDIQAADPSTAVNLIEPPQGNNTGDAYLAYPIETPPGRGGMQPQLSIAYNSGGANGWMGLGWNLTLPTVAIDTRWGVPRYDPGKETETYLLNGSQLTPLAHRGELVDRSAEKVFQERIEGAFNRIVRHGTAPTNYWWEITDKTGVRSIYGDPPGTDPSDTAVLIDGQGNIFRWALRERIDLNGNAVLYYYERVADTGLEDGSVAGWQLYPKSINYTVSYGASGPYTVEFTRADERRSDVIIDARGGFKMVTAALLARITIRYRDAQIRAYEFDYQKGAFSKTLLSAIRQLGENDELFNTHAFGYYHEAQEVAGFSAPETWSTGEDYVDWLTGTLIKEELLGNLTSFADEGQATVLSGAVSDSVGGRLYSGIALLPSKWISAGVTVGYNYSQTNTILTLIDINGDNLPDKVFQDQGGLYYRLNLTAPGLAPQFADAKKIVGIREMGKEESNTQSGGAEVYVGASVFTNTASTTTTGSIYFTDANGDGLPDLAKNGVIYFNHLQNGVPTFTTNSQDTPAPVGPGVGAQNVDVTAEELENYEKSIDAYPLLDSLRRWTAPYDGVVNVTAPVALLEDPGGEGDGVRVAVQHNASELWVVTIAGNDYTTHAPESNELDGIPVSAGDRLYFRVGSILDGRYDTVSWDPLIEYTGIEPKSDVNNLDEYRYQASQSFTLAGRTDIGFQAPMTGTVQLSGDLQKLAQTTDDIRLVITADDEIIFNERMAWNSTGSIPVQVSLPVINIHTEEETQATLIRLHVAIDSPIDLSAIAWHPRLTYTQVESGQENPALSSFDLPYHVDIYPVTNLSAPQEGWTAPQDGSLTVKTTFTSTDPSKGAVLFTVKRAGTTTTDPVTVTAGELLAKVTVKEAGEAAADAQLSVEVVQGDVLYFDYTTLDPELAATVTTAEVRVNYADAESESVPAALHSTLPSGLFAQPYRNWSYAGYNGNRERAGQPMLEDHLVFTPPQAGEEYDLSAASAYPFTPLPGASANQDRWGGADDLAYVSAAAISSSRLGVDAIVPPSLSAAGGAAPQMISRTLQNALGAGIGPASISYSGHPDMLGLDFLNGLPALGESYSERDFMDMNGDGFPDVVGNGEIQYTTMRGGLGSMQKVDGLTGWVRSTRTASMTAGIGGNVATFQAGANGTVANTGRGSPKGNRTGSQAPTLGISAGIGESASRVLTDLMDLNGDGLPDRLIVNCDKGAYLCVAFNLGYRFSDPEPWGEGEISVGAIHGFNFGPTLGFNSGIYDYAGGFSLERNRSLAACSRITPILENPNPISRPCDDQDAGTSLQDVNGDGLIDRVRAKNGHLYIAFNTGSGFAAEVDWASEVEQISLSTNTSLGGGAYFTVPIGPIPFVGFIIINPGVDYTRSIGRVEAQLRDIDGDGSADYLTSSNDDTLTVRRNLTGKTNLLQTVTRPLGATIRLDYQRDGNTYDNPSSRWNLTQVEVSDGYQGDGVDTQLVTYTYENGYYDRLEREFYGYQKVTAEQRDAANGNALYRATAREFGNTSYYTRSLLTRETMQDASGAKFAETQNTYVLRAVSGSGVTATRFPMLTRTDQRFYEGEQEPGKTTYTTQSYDNLGNIIRFFDDGDPNSQDQVVATVKYASCPDTYVMSIPVEITVTGNGTTMRRRQATVDCATGDVTQVRQYLADGSAAVTDLAYSPEGNLLQVTGPANLHGQRYQLSYEYDPDIQTYITQITDSFGYTSTATYDYKYGVVALSADVNGSAMRYGYDAFGRLTSVTGPYEQGGDMATLQFEYHPEAVVPWALTRHLDTFRDRSDPIETVVFTDGLKRVLQTKKDGTIYTGLDTPAQDVMIVSGRILFDGVGRPVEQYYPVTEPLGAPDVFNPAFDDSAQPTRTVYDILDRPVLAVMPDNTQTASHYGFGLDRSGVTQFETTVTDANGVQVISYQNALKLMVSQKQSVQGSAQFIWTSYTYDPLKQLREIVDDQGNYTRIAYDHLGRQTAMRTPDTGRTEVTYDLASNILSKVTAALRASSKQITYDYDFNRLKSISYPNYPGNNVAYFYGEPGAADNRAGRITLVTSQAGVEERFYGKLGEVIQTTNTFAAFVPANGATIYTTQYTYDNWGRLQTLVYPDGEVLTYRYDSGGQLQQASGQKGSFSYDYVLRLEYDRFGQQALIETGNHVRTTYTYRPDNRRLENLQAGKGQGNPFQNLTYTYDNTGNILSLVNDVAVARPASQYGGPSSQTFRYDDLYRLVEASGAYQFSPDKTNRYTLALSYDSLNNILTKQQSNEIVQPSGSVTTQADTSYNWSYAYTGLGPHAATHIGDRTYTYDANGNQLGWTSDLNGTRRRIAWDEENRIQRIWDNGREESYKYDDEGQRAIRRGSQGETITVNPFYAVRNGKIATKQIFAGDTRLVSKLVKEDAREKDQYYYHPDHLGSSSFITDANGQVYEHVEYFPFGETWVQESSNAQRTPYLYTGKELDAETGLYYYGARYYDPRTSLWQSADPAIAEYLADPSSGEIYKPANLSLYTYGQQNPLKYIDPDGCRIVPAKGSSPQFVAQVTQAMNYLARSHTADQVLRGLIKDRKHEVKIKEISDDSDRYDASSNTVYWNPTKGLVVTSKTKKVTGSQSPALALLHELGHALQSLVNPDQFRRDTPITNQVQPEEVRNLWDVEIPAAVELNEPIRENYGDCVYALRSVSDPTVHTRMPLRLLPKKPEAPKTIAFPSFGDD